MSRRGLIRGEKRKGSRAERDCRAMLRRGLTPENHLFDVASSEVMWAYIASELIWSGWAPARRWDRWPHHRRRLQ